jgi:predicted metal-dependent hydrolase
MPQTSPFAPVADPQLGLILPHPHATATRFIFRTSPEGIKMTCPARATRKQVLDAIEKSRDGIAKMQQKSQARKAESIEAGAEITMAFFTLRVSEAPVTRFFTAGPIKEGVLPLVCPKGTDYASPQARATIADLLNTYCRKHAPSHLVERAKELAKRIGARPRAIGVSYGKQRLGRCDTRGEILLSYRLMYYPAELVDLVIYHELAHLTEMNHGPRFYALLDSYVGGRHDELNRRLKAFRCPVE